MAVFGVSTAYLAYVGAYALATAGCLLALPRATRVSDSDTRRGLVGLLVGSGGWAALELAYLLAPTSATKYAAYLASLVVGLTTVGAWLYFASAYTGRSFHRTTRYRRAAVTVYLAIVAVKVTNPIHGLYFRTLYVTTPFPHLTIEHQTFHWVVTGLSYALVAVGFFMLYELFLEADYDTRPLAALVGLTGVPVVLDIVGFTSQRLIDINYEPLGVAVFALGVLYVFDTQFLAVQLTDGVDDPVIYLDDDGRIREYNGLAADLFPALDGATGRPLGDALPDVAGALETDDQILERTRDGETRYHLVSTTAFTLGQVDIGRMVVVSDVTQVERQRRELSRQNEQLEGIAAAIRHEMLNTLQIVRGRVNIAGEALEDDDVETARESLRTASSTAERMTNIVSDLARLARHGQTVERVDTVALGEVTEDARRAADLDGLDVSVDADGEVAADPSRLRNLLESGLTFAAHNGADAVTVAATDEGFTITDDGEPPDRDDPAPFFEYGQAVPDGEAGLTLPNLRMLAETHGWEATIDTGYDDGTRIVVTGARADATA
ncbi:histidine kinase N-terminal 7TM domain-containing protein [Haloarcula litorea]|uniref:histidine kinase N-terminal 7TM domain-containing protein n=1 Tax=Haloarcula litorea TaxID=3032579 RepID=UPI0023E7B9D8|nr:histidine kinase N-terminal 7TM domain-containing protein [Halomicroarcula sp. GDY20]